MRFLPSDDRRALLITSFRLAALRHDYVLALSAWERLRKDGAGRRVLASIRPVFDEIVRQLSQPHAYRMSGRIDERGSWVVHLFKRQFRIEVGRGLVCDVKLKCARGFVAFRFDPVLQYEVQGRYGSCVLALEGTPDTQLTLIQSGEGMGLRFPEGPAGWA